MTIDQVKVIEIGADAIEEVLHSAPFQGLAYPPKLMHAVVVALGRHGFIIEDRYEEDTAEPETPIPDLVERLQTLGKTAADWEVSGDDT